MRNWLNGILTFIGSTSLTDEEYASVNVLNLEVNLYNQDAYDQLSAVLATREAVSTMQDKLAALFKIKGLDVVVADTGRSNIFVGSVLE